MSTRQRAGVDEGTAEFDFDAGSPSVLAPDIAAAADRGWLIFPVRAGAKAPPLISDWPNKATCSIEKLEAWSLTYADCNWALACGPESGVYVLDIDGPDGAAQIVEWQRRGWKLPATRTHLTARGRHLLFRWPPGFVCSISAGRLGPGLDERGEGGYILLPPSLHPSGHRYVCEDGSVPLADMPQWLVDLHYQKPAKPNSEATPIAKSIERGQRRPLLFKVAGKLRAEGVPMEGILSTLRGLNSTFAEPHEEEVLRLLVQGIERYPAGEPHPDAAPTTSEPDWPVLPDPALHGLAGDVVRVIAPHSEADPSAILLQMLVAVGNIVGTGPYCMVESTRHALNLYAVLVGQSSKARKGTSWGHVERLCSLVDEPWASGRVTGGLSSAEGLIAEVQDDAEPPRDRRLLVLQAELASVLRTMTREGNTLSPLLRAAWDSGNLRTMVKHDPQRATGAHISLVAHITRLELLRYLSDTEQHNGFANRMLWCAIKRSKFLPEGGCVPEIEMTALAHRLRDVIEWVRRMGEMEMRRDDAARRLWAAVYPRLSEGLPGLLGAATSRAEAQVLRLSALYAILDRSTTICVEHLRPALAVWDYCLASARLIFGDATGNPVADRIPCTPDTFKQLLEEKDFLVGEVVGTKLVSGLALNDDLEAHERFQQEALQ